ncbi:hypothetical protein GUJ93_ZPchr0006g44189 [Zizania palustris]|uniref:Uncharacterized protein n=1 Tax=Zizania palustris TaxID=103762 RepID=A0A8J5TAX1_ZIZPA|nr:hypothetical protein GUJ93_ZPchr0006g44189 [Zizania palustris]
MQLSLANSLATSAYAKGANDPLPIEVTEGVSPTEEHVHTIDEITESGNTNGGESPGSKPPLAKKPKMTVEDPNIAMVTMIGQSLGNLAIAIKNMTKAFNSDGEIPEEHYDTMMSIPGFDVAHLDHYYAYLCDHPPKARAFYKFPLSSKMIWVARYIKEHLSCTLLVR